MILKGSLPPSYRLVDQQYKVKDGATCSVVFVLASVSWESGVSTEDDEAPQLIFGGLLRWTERSNVRYQHGGFVEIHQRLCGTDSGVHTNSPSYRIQNIESLFSMNNTEICLLTA